MGNYLVQIDEVLLQFLLFMPMTKTYNSKCLRKKYVRHVSTDLGSLNGIFDCGNPHNTVRKFSNSPATLILRDFHFGCIQKVKNCLFNNFEGFVFWKKLSLENANSFQNFKLQRSLNGQNGSFWGFKMSKIDYM